MSNENEQPSYTVYAEIDKDGVIINTAIFEDTKTPENLGLATTWIVYVPEESPNDVPPLKNWVKDENGIWNPPADKPYPEDHILDGDSPWYWKDPDGTGDGDWALVKDFKD